MKRRGSSAEARLWSLLEVDGNAKRCDAFLGE